MKKPRKKIFYVEEFDLHFNNMYKDIFKNNYDTFDNRYNWCCREYMTGIRYNRSKRRYDHTSNRYILAAMFQKDKIEHRSKHEELAYDVILPIEYIKQGLPPILPNPILDNICSLLLENYKTGLARIRIQKIITSMITKHKRH